MQKDITKFTLNKTRTSVELSTNRYKATGDLTIHGVAKSITARLYYQGTKVNPNTQKQTSCFQATTRINHSACL